jgi:hypothetical protein
MTRDEVIHKFFSKKLEKNNFRKHKKEQTLVMGEIIWKLVVKGKVWKKSFLWKLREYWKN